MSRTPRFTLFRQELATAFTQIGIAFRHLVKGPPARALRPRVNGHIPTFIVAYNFPQAREYARFKGFGGDWIYIVEAHQVYGYKRVRLHLLDGWRNNKPNDLIRAVEQLERFNREAA